jgi:hypothetical protein
VLLDLIELELEILVSPTTGRVVGSPCKLELEMDVELRTSVVMLDLSDVELEYE